MAKLCHMGFGYKLEYPDAGDYTGGAEPVRTSRVDFDGSDTLVKNCRRLVCH